MANGDKKSSTLTVRLLDDHWQHMKPSLDVLKEQGRRYPAVVMACMIEGEFTFWRNPQDIIRFRDRWTPAEDETTRKDFRCSESFEQYFRRVANGFKVDLNSYIIASLHRSLSYFRENPEMVDIVYREWAEKQLANCMSPPVQTRMAACKSAGNNGHKNESVSV